MLALQSKKHHHLIKVLYINIYNWYKSIHWINSSRYFFQFSHLLIKQWNYLRHRKWLIYSNNSPLFVWNRTYPIWTFHKQLLDDWNDFITRKCCDLFYMVKEIHIEHIGDFSRYKMCDHRLHNFSNILHRGLVLRRAIWRRSFLQELLLLYLLFFSFYEFI